MSGSVDIVNRALSKLGEAHIASLDDDVKTASLAASMYDNLRDAEISSHAWHFAKCRVMLPSLSEKPAFGWNFQYLLPADNLRVLEAGPWPQAVIDNLVGADSRSFTLEGRNVLTNHGPLLNLVYLRRVTDVAMYPPVFIEALASRLAVEMCESVTGSNTKRELAWNEYNSALTEARRINALGLPPQMIQDDSWMLARHA
ncbi:hypothetical protein C4J81_11530 [Deltaproteobacteria bacterium Smac51]|nr:hypothetical protein C4J81_11530 [Deltaproteobacteria bacterium Smac51]